MLLQLVDHHPPRQKIKIELKQYKALDITETNLNTKVELMHEKNQVEIQGRI